LLQGFFHEVSSPKSLKITLRSFQFFGKFEEIFASQGAPLVSTTQVANLATVNTGVVDISLPPVSTIPAANLPSHVNDTGGK
jgi:hypothetical protein